MAIIKTCCCGWTLRRGCYVSATYSFIYFFLFTWITGYMTVGRIQPLFMGPDHPNDGEVWSPHDTNHIMQIERGNDVPSQREHGKGHRQQRVMDRGVTTVVSVPTSLPNPKGAENTGEDNNYTRRNLSNSSSTDPNLQMENDVAEVSTMHLFLVSEFFSIVQTVNLVIDLLCEVAGVYSSLLLIRGLQMEKKKWFWPWMIVVPTHIAIDAITLGSIVMEHAVKPMETPLSFLLSTVFVDVTLNSINAYGLICVISQYQEYGAGRGTAAYVEFTSQTPSIVLESATSTKTLLNHPMAVSGQRRRSSQKEFSTSRTFNTDKSDTCCEEFSLQTVTNGNENQCLFDGQNHNNKGTKNGKIKNGQVTLIAPNEENKISVKNGMVTEDDGNGGGHSIVIVDARNKRGSFGQYLDVQNRKGSATKGILKQTGNNAELMSGNRKGSNTSSTMQTEQSEAASKSDSDSDDPVVVDALSAFGFNTRG